VAGHLLKSYAFRRGQFMSAATKERRLAKAKLFLVRLKGHLQRMAGSSSFFDEKNLSQDQKINRKNNR
jgi:hypothetical protein